MCNTDCIQVEKEKGTEGYHIALVIVQYALQDALALF